MNIFISCSHKDKDAADRIASRLESDGHDVWMATTRISAGMSISKSVDAALSRAEIFILLVSENSFTSAWVQSEFSTIALGQISKRTQRIIPVRIDKSPVPNYLQDRLYLDLSSDFESGLEQLSKTLHDLPAHLGSDTIENIAISETTGAHDLEVHQLRDELRKGQLTLVCGAGISVEAGVPAWDDLLLALLEKMVQRISKDRHFELNKEAALELQRTYKWRSSLVLAKYLKANLGDDFSSELRKALYVSKPSSCPLIDSIIELSRPRRDVRALDSIITFNFDELIEENLTRARISNKAIFSEQIRYETHELPVYHVHGFLPRRGKVTKDPGLVFSEDAYHSQFIEPFSWSNLIQLNKLTQNTCLFVGISLTDPNMRRLLDIAWRKNTNQKPGHYIIKKLPLLTGDDKVQWISRFLEEQDANALGLHVLWIKDYSEIPSLLNYIADPIADQ